MTVILIEVNPGKTNKAHGLTREWYIEGNPSARVYWNPVINDLMINDEVFDNMTHDEVAAVDALRHQLRNGAIMAKLLWSQEGQDAKWTSANVENNCPTCQDTRRDGLDSSK